MTPPPRRLPPSVLDRDVVGEQNRERAGVFWPTNRGDLVTGMSAALRPAQACGAVTNRRRM